MRPSRPRTGVSTRPRAHRPVTQESETGARPSARDTILALAMEVLDRQGEVAIRVNHLAEQAGVTPPTLYRHFGSRDGLVVAAQAERYARSLRATIDDAGLRLLACTCKTDVRACIAGIFASYGTAEGSQRRRERLNVLGGAYARPELEMAITRAQREANSGVVALVENFKSRGLAAPDVDAHACAYWMTGLILGRPLIELEGSDVDGDSWDRLAVDAVCAALFGGRGAS